MNWLGKSSLIKSHIVKKEWRQCPYFGSFVNIVVESLNNAPCVLSVKVYPNPYFDEKSTHFSRKMFSIDHWKSSICWPGSPSQFTASSRASFRTCLMVSRTETGVGNLGGVLTTSFPRDGSFSSSGVGVRGRGLCSLCSRFRGDASACSTEAGLLILLDRAQSLKKNMELCIPFPIKCRGCCWGLRWFNSWLWRVS